MAIPLSLELNISDISDDPYREAQDIGWCGEAAIQSAITTYGVYIPQKLINSISNPKYKDLYTNDIPITLNRLGFGFEFYPNNTPSYTGYILWMKDFLSYEIPVLFGLLVYPDFLKGSDISHFMLAVGYDKDRLFFNSNSEDGQDRESFENLYNSQGYSFLNESKTFFGVAIGRTLYSEKAGVVQLHIVEENKKKVELLIVTNGLKKGESISRYELVYDKKVESLIPLKKSRKTLFTYPKIKDMDVIDRQKSYVYMR